MSALVNSVVQKNNAPWRDTCSEPVLSHLQLPSFSQMHDKMSGNLSFDVAIIGGGFAGLSAAVEAATRGASVIVLEGQSGLAMGASGRNAGILCAGINMPITFTPRGSAAAELWSATQLKLYDVLSEAHAQSSFIDVERCGAICLATSKTASARLLRETRARMAAGMTAEIISAARVAEMSSGLIDTRSVLNAMLLPDEGAIHPFTLIATLANRARQAGAQIYGGARVENIEKRGTRRGSPVSGSPVSGPPVSGFSAGGSPPDGYLLSLAGGRSLTCRSLISAVGPMTGPTSRIFALSFKFELPPKCPVWWDANPYVYYDYRPGNGCLTVSGGRYGIPGSDKADKRYHSKMAAATRRWVPALADVEPEYCWGVDLNVAPDLLPEIVEKDDNWLSVQGLGALGVLPGLVLGARAAARLIN